MESLLCRRCRSEYPVDDEIADFSGGTYFDVFNPSDGLRDWHARALETERVGATARIREYYLPQIRQLLPEAKRVLDCGCGNGISVDLLSAAGIEAWGNDLSQLRKWQWQKRETRHRLVVASGHELPFPDAYFDAVLSSGVIEHIGVSETLPPRYSVLPAPDQWARRLSFLKELERVLAPGGVLFVDCPNGAFPLDFWHGNSPGTARVHSSNEKFLPTYREIANLLAESGFFSVAAISPWRRLQFRQAAAHLHGKLLRIPVALLFILMTTPPFRWLAASPLNPFLVVRARKYSPGG